MTRPATSRIDRVRATRRQPSPRRAAPLGDGHNNQELGTVTYLRSTKSADEK
jgi:hypothetical protein